MLLAQPHIIRLEVSAEALVDEKHCMDEIERVAQKTDQALKEGKDVVIYTSRQLLNGKDSENSLSIGQQISRGLVGIIDQISALPAL